MKRILGIISLACISILLCSADTSFAKKAKIVKHNDEKTCPYKGIGPIKTVEATFLSWEEADGETPATATFKSHRTGKEFWMRIDIGTERQYKNNESTVKKLKKGNIATVTYQVWQYIDGEVEANMPGQGCMKEQVILSIKRR